MAMCRGCGAQIEWIKTTAGKSMPVDPEPVFVVTGEGKYHFVTDAGEVITGRKARPDEGGTSQEVAFVPHWATCPAAHQFRR